MLEGFIVLVICLAILIVVIQIVMPRFGITEERARAGSCGCSCASCGTSSGATPSSCPTPEQQTPSCCPPKK